MSSLIGYWPFDVIAGLGLIALLLTCVIHPVKVVVEAVSLCLALRL